MPSTTFLQAVLEASWQGSLVIALILLLRPLLGSNVPARWRSLLWSLALLRLLVPALILPPSPTSFQNLAAVDRPFETAGWVFERSVGTQTAPALLQSQRPDESQAPLASPAPTMPPRRVWWQVAAIGWVSGCALTGVWILAGTIILSRRLRRDFSEVDEDIRRVWERCCERIFDAGKSFHRLRLAQTSAVRSPALVGLFRPVLLIPREDCKNLTAEDWEHVFLHELAHFRRGDHWIQALQLVALCAHWFNPLVWVGFRYLRADRELAADEWALQHLADRRPVAYGDTLLKVLSGQSRHGLEPGLVGIMEDRAQMKERLSHIIAFRPRNITGSIIGVTLVSSLAAIILTAAQAQVSPLAGWSVISVSIPKDGEIKDAYLELKSPTGRMITLTKDVTSDEGVTLDKLEWFGSPIRVVVTLRKGKERVELTADPSLVSKKNDLRRKPAQVEIESKFIEVPDAVADGLAFPSSKSFMDKYPGTPSPLPKQRALSLRAVLNEGDAEQLISGLNTQKGVEILSAPRVTTRSEQRATVEIIREFRYPTEYEQDLTKDGKPWVPTAFETRNCGVTLEVEPRLIESGIIDLNVAPQVVEFLGFVNYPSGKVSKVEREPNLTFPERLVSRKAFAVERLEDRTQPVFSTRSTRASVSISSGQTLVFVGSNDTELPKGFELPSAGKQLIVLVRASEMNPEKALPPRKETPPEALAKILPPASDAPAAMAVEGKPGFVISPHDPKAGYIDVRGFPAGTEVKCPYSGKMFRVP